MTDGIHPTISKLARLCKSWGGALKFVSENEYADIFHVKGALRLGWYDSPAELWHGVNYEQKTVYVVPEHTHPGVIIHEMGHVFADPKGKVENSDEWEWLGWEIAMARRLRCYKIWSKQNKDYGIGDVAEIGERTEGRPWGDLGRNEERMACIDRIKHARKLGLIDKCGKPLSIR